MRRQRVPVGDEVQALVLLLQPHPVLERAVVVADVHAARRAHARTRRCQRTSSLSVNIRNEGKRTVRNRGRPAVQVRASDRSASRSTTKPSPCCACHRGRPHRGSNAGDELQAGQGQRDQGRHHVVEHPSGQQEDDHDEPVGLQPRLAHTPGDAGSRLTAMRPPSSGRIGSRFNTISTTLIMIPVARHHLQALARRAAVRRRNRYSNRPEQRHREVGPGPGGRHPEHVALRVAQIAEIDRHRLRPAEDEPRPRQPSSSSPSGNEHGSDRIDVLQRIRVTRPSIHAVESPNSWAT